MSTGVHHSRCLECNGIELRIWFPAAWLRIQAAGGSWCCKRHVLSLLGLTLRAYHTPGRRRNLRAICPHISVRLVVAHSLGVPTAGNRSSKRRLVDKVSGPQDTVMGRVAYPWKRLQACEPHKKMPSRYCWDTRSPLSLTVAPAGSHIC